MRLRSKPVARWWLSWTFFRKVSLKLDSHPPKGLHLHLDSGPQVSVEVKTLKEAIQFFEKKVIEHFGELEGAIYENFHVQVLT